MLYQRQNSKINFYVTMDESGGDKLAQVVPSCVYDLNVDPRETSSPGDLWATETKPTPISTKQDNVRTGNTGTVSGANYRTDAINANHDYMTPTTCTSNGQFQTISFPSGATNFGDFMTMDFGSDVKIAHAAKQALLEGQMTPLIKEELKCAIQTKRLREGKEELKVEFTEPQQDTLTPEEEVRVEKRREQNRMAAQRFRERQKDRATHLQKQVQKLESSHTDLRYELDQVRKERDELKKAFAEHMAMCPGRFPAQFYVSTTTNGELT